MLTFADTHLAHRRPGPNLAELHIHLGSAADAAILYSIAHAQGIRLPVNGFWKFVEMVTATPDQVSTFEEYLDLFYWTELLQSSPEALQSVTHAVISSLYRHVNVDLVELRYCPAKRNRGGERDLDHIIVASLQGMQRALLEYGEVQAGIILCADRSLAPEVNEAIFAKAARYRSIGVVGVDLAGPVSNRFGSLSEMQPLFARAHAAGLGVTIHTGEMGDADEVWQALEYARPQRIGHGVRAVDDPALLERLAADGVVLELCPTSNLRTSVVRDLAHWRRIIDALRDYGVPFTINTDGPEMLQTDLYRERELLHQAGILTEAELARCDEVARAASFIRRGVPFAREL